MHKLLNPRSVFIINTIPTVILAVLFYSEFAVIKSLLTKENITYWQWFSLSLFLLGGLNIVFAGLTIHFKKNLSIYYGIIIILLYVPFLYLFHQFSDQIIPLSIPGWMVPENIIFYSGTFLMPTLIHALLVISIRTSSERNTPWKNFLLAILIPVMWYVFIQIILPLWQPVDSTFGVHSVLIIIITATVVFLFFLIRGVVILSLKKGKFYRNNKLLWLIPFTIIFPLLGLGVNSGQLWSEAGGGFGGIFGDFSGSWFYILAVVNGVLLCLPDLSIVRYRLVLFIGRSITFVYTLYFFLVFLPFLPLSIIAIVAIGAGFLMLTPIVLFVLHVQQLSADFKYLHENFRNKILISIWVACLSVIPLFIIGFNYHHKYVLNQALEYLYHPDYSKDYKIDSSSLHSTLHTIKLHKERSRNLFENGTPILSILFNWIVLDNLTLSDSKIKHIERVFFGESTEKNNNVRVNESIVEISNIITTSRYDANENHWISQVDLEITNQSPNSWGAEFETSFSLPTGCWISDYYLYIGDKKEPGLLTEKKSATWVYSSIRNQNRDPGILYYLSGNKVAFKIFPFLKDETRKSGIEFIHKEAVEITIDNHTVLLGNPETESSNTHFENDDLVYLSARSKSSLKKIQRTPYPHFIVDVSKDRESLRNEYIHRIENYIQEHPLSAGLAKVSFTNSMVTTVPFTDWTDQLDRQEFTGGFFLERAIQKALVEHHTKNDATFPVLIVVSDSHNDGILSKNFSDLHFTFPENDFFYFLNAQSQLQPHSLLTDPLMRTLENDIKPGVLEYVYDKNKRAYLPDDGQPSIILKNQNINIEDLEVVERDWNNAIQLEGLLMNHRLHPNQANKEWIQLVKMSFDSKILTPLTSYIVVENEAQRMALLRKQELVLAGNKELDVSEDAQNMSEPNLLLVGIIFTMLFLWKNRKAVKVSVSLKRSRLKS